MYTNLMFEFLEDILHAGKIFFPKDYKKFTGSADSICRDIVKNCWTGSYFKSAESPRLDQFWLRDFSWSLKGLLYLGYQEEVQKNLSWALKKYATAGKVTTTLLSHGYALDFPHYSADSIPMLLYCLKTTNSHSLISDYKDFLNREIIKYKDTVFDDETALVKKVKYLAEPKDIMRRTQTCVSNSFMIMLANLLAEIPELDNPFEELDLKASFINAFWTGKYFRNDLEPDGNFISSDANVWPYWTGAVDSNEMLKGSIDSISEAGLDKPFPLKYQIDYKMSWMHPSARIFFPNYQGDSIWTLHTPIFIEQVNKIYPNKAKFFLKQYMNLIEEYKTFVEVFEPDGSDILKGSFGLKSDTGMLWAAAIPYLTDKIYGTSA